MDAVRRYWRILYVLVFERGLIIVLLGAFYLLAAFLAIVLERDKTANVILVLAAIPACGLSAIVSERVVLCAADCALLGVPNAVRILRNGQIAVLGLVVGIPVCLALLCGSAVGMAALLILPAAVGALLVERGRGLGLVWIVLVVAANVFPTALSRIVSASADPALRWGAIVLAAASLCWWLGLAERIRQRTLGYDLPAVGGQIASAAGVGGAPNLTQAQVDTLDQTNRRKIKRIATDIADDRVTYDALAFGLGIATPHWRGLAKWICIAWAAMFVVHVSSKANVQYAAFFWIAALAISALFSRLRVIRFAWQSFAAEESLLSLTPKWPDAAAVKWLFLELIIKNQVAVWVGWILVIAPFMAAGWIERSRGGASILALLATSCGFTGAVLFALSRRDCHDGISISTVCFLLCAGLGVAVCLLGSVAFPYAHWAGSALIAVPLLVGGISFLTRPLQFPVQVIHKSKSGQV